MAEPNVLARRCPAVDPYQNVVLGGPAQASGHYTGPNHELTLVMTKERADAMAGPSVLALACSV